MEAPAAPPDEKQRLAELHEYRVLDSMPEQEFDDITMLASQIAGTPIALLSFVDNDRQWFKSRVGTEMIQTDRDISFCGHAILQPTDLFVVEDATIDLRFEDNPLVITEPPIRFYAGAPLVTSSGRALGALCVIDRVPRQLSLQQQDALRALARQLVAQLDLRLLKARLQRSAAEARRYQRELEAAQHELKETNLRLAMESTTDSLTKLRNRRGFTQRMADEVERSHRYGNPLSLVLLDVDGFKGFNDANGHPAGDRLLQKIAESLEAGSRVTDLVARIGGDEFAVILSDTDRAGAIAAAERIRQALADSDWEDRPVTVSIGVATQEEAPTSEGLMATADRALYEAKEVAGNTIEIALDPGALPQV